MFRINHVESEHGLKYIISEVRDGITFLTFVYPYDHVVEIPIDDLEYVFRITQTNVNVATISLIETKQPRRDITVTNGNIHRLFRSEELSTVPAVLFYDDSALSGEHIDNLYIWHDNAVVQLYTLKECLPEPTTKDEYFNHWSNRP